MSSKQRHKFLDRVIKVGYSNLVEDSVVFVLIKEINITFGYVGENGFF